MKVADLRLRVSFFRTGSGAEPVRRWLRSLSQPQKKAIGEDIKTVQYGWPLGMPLVEKIEPYLWEVRTRVPDGIARAIFTVDGNLMILRELSTARSRLRQYQEGG